MANTAHLPVPKAISPVPTPTASPSHNDDYVALQDAPPAKHDDDYVAIQDYSQRDDDETGLSEPRASTSWRASRRSTSRVRLSRLESMMHEEHAAALIPMPILYVTIAVALMGSFQFGWLLSQLNYRPFNVDCLKVPIPDQACIMFPGHSGNEWTMAVTAWIVGGAIGAMTSGYPADKFGRQRTLFLIAITMIIGGVLETVSSEIYLFSFGRVVSGIASGAAINVSNEDSLGNYAFFIFVAFLVAYVVFIYFVVPETAQKTFDEIQKEFDIEPAHKNDDDEEAPKQDPWAS
ncbi:hypothetical protein SPRG_20106 [Saprolegnia parasitica CBS 223.65]|uniref:Major facilitator superfamily (MFS) profile domain-containing protein n=1 Tax=Saprolegnia parasitica (strain CBS 223.65) TaxID=695850 RepID=A0A067CR32_SAPPC|nr:hypothetical protein SPRG_20106 [Saprolegnia parasitica CBS 223.65]KDO29001.1 hypothetical protein SPRG_20106 [Saprolegnia parasitica CBS 223.65]|eukprot:XP_012200330.1 hypothetical protein SPRG_20106 [Saprolegnia parasitica CBS 223.65]